MTLRRHTDTANEDQASHSRASNASRNSSVTVLGGTTLPDGGPLCPLMTIAFMSEVEAPVMDLRPLLYCVDEIGQHSFRLADAWCYEDDQQGEDV
ncbi:hypothetical protein KIN20_037147 [Parelaphostrongylus tenuis]|uniref:Uncharacterized protein n=1 Tax=Parelaphostrongylus tenuis TaxID=148309 RepID=A0AAD5RDJ9_PARTN|nr:hypothetical protein KIN20_037147 [Parelaphostrongylus tenuis]